MENGQAESAPESIESIAALLEEHPEEESEEVQEEAEEGQSEEDQGEEVGTDDDEPEKEESEQAESQEPKKFKVTVKGEDGSDVEKEVDEAELKNGYLRQADYTRKAQALSKQEAEIASTLREKHEQIRTQYMTQAETARAVALKLAGFKTPQEMFELAQNDPATAVAEEQRQRMIGQMIGQIDQELNQERQKQAAEMEQARQNAQSKAWEKLSTEGITRDGLAKVYKDSIDKYGVNQDSLNYLYDPGLVLMMRDALAYRELKNKVPEVTKKANEAPKVPIRQSQAQERKNKELETKFRSGKAKLNDLAAFLRG